MARPLRLDPRDVHRAPEIAAVLGIGAPARLAGSLADGSAGRRRAVTLVPPVTWVRSKQLVTALALAAISTGHGVPSREDAPSAHAHRSSISTSANAPAAPLRLLAAFNRSAARRSNRKITSLVLGQIQTAADKRSFRGVRRDQWPCRSFALL